MAIQRVTVVGAGTMGSGIAQVCATSGYPVNLVDVSPEQIQRGLKGIEQSLRRFAEKGRLSDACHRFSSSPEMTAMVRAYC